jgi:hypothetical protein
VESLKNIMATSGSFITWLKANPLRAALAVICVAAAVLVSIQAVHSMGAEAIDRTHSHIFMDSETGKVFTVELTKGMKFPVISPDTGKATGYEPETCYWNADGSAKTTPTYVILNAALGKPGPTFCPDCGRLVVAHNPPANGQSPPPTREEYEKRDGSQ